MSDPEMWKVKAISHVSGSSKETFTPKEILEYHKLNVRQLMVMDALRRDRPMTLTELSKEVHCSTAAMTALRDKLVRIGFVKCFESKTDRRLSVVSLLAPGYRAFQYLTERLVCATEAAHAKAEKGRECVIEMEELRKKLSHSEKRYAALAAHHNQHCTCNEIY